MDNLASSQHDKHVFYCIPTYNLFDYQIKCLKKL